MFQCCMKGLALILVFFTYIQTCIGVYCPAGSYSVNDVCVGCAAGKFAMSAGSIACQDCYLGYYSPAASSTSCVACSAGYFSSATGASVCQACSPGTYAQSYAFSSCWKCAAGLYLSSLGGTVCVMCSAGTYSSTVGSSGCVVCPVGSYCPVGGSTIINCPAGTYSNATGLTSMSKCEICPSGRFCPAGSTVPVNCSNGTFSASGAGECTVCPDFSQNGMGSTVCQCNAGYYQNGPSGSVAFGLKYLDELYPSVWTAFPPYITVLGSMNFSIAQGSTITFKLQNFGGVSFGLQLYSSLFGLNQDVINQRDYISGLTLTVLEHISYTKSYAASQSFTYSTGVSGQGSNTLTWDTTNVPSGLYYLLPNVGSDKRYAIDLFVASPTPVTITYYLNTSSVPSETVTNPVAACLGDTVILDKVSVIPFASIGVYCFPTGVIGYSDLVLKAMGAAPLSWTVDSGLGNTQCVIGMDAYGLGNRIVSVMTIYNRSSANTQTPVSWSELACEACTRGYWSGVNSKSCTACAIGYYSLDAATECIHCPAGKYSSIGSSECSNASIVAPVEMVSCQVGTFGVYPNCSACPPNTNSTINHTSTLLDCRCLAGFVCTYTKRISVVLTLHEITWNMTTIVGLSQSAVVDAIAQAAGVSRDKVVISSVLPSRRRLLEMLTGRTKHRIFITVSDTEGLDVQKAYELLGVKAHIAWEHKHALRVAREFTE